MNVEYFRMLYDYNYAAHHRLWHECILPLSDEQYTRPLTYSVGSIHAQVVHVMSAEWLWFSRLKNESPAGMFNPDDYADRAAVHERWLEVEAMVWNHVTGLTDADLMKAISYRNLVGTVYTSPQAHILANVVNHGTDHRSQILAMIDGMGGPTIGHDMIMYLRGDWTTP